MPDSGEMVELIFSQLREAREAKELLEKEIHALDIRVTLLESVRALAWKWGAGAAAAISLVITVWHAIWSMIG